MYFRARLAVLVSIVATGPLLADDGPTKPAVPPAQTEEQRTLESFGAQNKTCLEWSDGCAVCVRKEAETIACSLPGIACEPSTLVCRTEAKTEPKPDKPAK